MKLTNTILSTSALCLTAYAGPLATKTTTQAASATSCTVTEYASVSAAVKSCTSIALSGITVPAGDYLELTKLKDGATVTFEGTTVRSGPR